MSFYTDIKLLTLELKVDQIIKSVSKIKDTYKDETVNNIINEYIPKMNELNEKMDKVISIYKRFNEIDNKSVADEKDIIISLYEIMTEIGDESHELSIKLAHELNISEDKPIRNLVKGMIKCLERLYIKTRYNNIIKLFR